MSWSCLAGIHLLISASSAVSFPPKNDSSGKDSSGKLSTPGLITSSTVWVVSSKDDSLVIMVDIDVRFDPFFLGFVFLLEVWISAVEVGTFLISFLTGLDFDDLGWTEMLGLVVALFVLEKVDRLLGLVVALFVLDLLDVPFGGPSGEEADTFKSFDFLNVEGALFPFAATTTT